MPLLGNQPVIRNLSGEMTVSLPFPNYSEQFYLPTSCTAQNYNVKIKVWMKLIFFFTNSTSQIKCLEAEQL